MNKILFPTDFSECANHAENAAVELAKKFEAVLEIIHIVDNTIFKWESEEHFEETINMLPTLIDHPHIKNVHTGLEGLKAAMNKKQEDLLLQGVNAKTKILFGEPNTAITEYSKETKPALVVMGTHGASGIREDLIGSKTEWVNRHSPCPVLSIREVDENTFKINDILYVSNFSDRDENKNLEQINIFANSFNAKVHLLFINTPHQFEETYACYNRIEYVAKKHGLDNFDIHIYNHFTVEDGALAFIEHFETDIVSIANHGGAPITRWTEFRTTEVLINHSKVPVLSMNYK